MRELDLLDRMRSNQTIVSSKKGSGLAKRELDENIPESSQSSAVKSLQAPQPNIRVVSNRQTHESFLKPPSRQRDVSPLGGMDLAVKNHVISPSKSYRVKTGIGSGIRNLMQKQEQSNVEKRNEHALNMNVQVLQMSNESEQPPKPQQVPSVLESANDVLLSRHSRELNEFQRIEQEILSS